MVDLYQTEKTHAEIIREYNLTASIFDKWITKAQTTGPFSEKDNLNLEQKELNALRKRNTVLIFGRKGK